MSILLFSASHDESLKKWDIPNGIEMKSINIKDQINSMKVNKHGNFLATGAYQSLTIYDTRNLDVIWKNAEAHTKNVQIVGFFEDGNRMYTGGEDGIAKIWDVRTDKPVCDKAYQMPSPVNGICLHPNQNELIVADSQGVIYVWDLTKDCDYTSPIELGITEFYNHIDIDDNGRSMCAVTNRGRMFIFEREDLNQYNCPNHFNAKDMMKIQIPEAFEEDDEDENGMSAMMMPADYDAGHEEPPPSQNYQHKKTIQGHDSFILKCRYSPNGEILATSGSDGMVKLWQYQVGRNYQLQRTITDKKQTIEEYSFESIHLVDSLLLNLEQSSDVQAASDVESALWTLEMILCYAPEHVGKGWQKNAIETFIRRALLPQNSNSIRKLAIRLFLIWYQTLSIYNNVTPQLDRVFQCLLAFFPLRTGESTERILLQYCEGPSSTAQTYPGNLNLSAKLTPLFIFENSNETAPQAFTNMKERARQLQHSIDKFLEYICSQTQKIEWGDQSKRFDCAKFLMDRIIHLYIFEVFPDLEVNGVDVFAGWEGNQTRTEILETADPVIIARYWLIKWVCSIASAKLTPNPTPALLLYRSALLQSPKAINTMLSLLKEAMCLPLPCSSIILKSMNLIKHWLLQKELPPFVESSAVSLQSFSLLLIHTFTSFFDSPYIANAGDRHATALTITSFALQIARDFANPSNVFPRQPPKIVWNDLIKELTACTLKICGKNDSFASSTSGTFTGALLVVSSFVYAVREVEIDDKLWDDIWNVFKQAKWASILDVWSKNVEILTKSLILNVFGIDPTLPKHSNDDSDRSTSKRSYSRSDRSETESNQDFPRSEADDLDDCDNEYESANNKELKSLVRSTGNPEKWLRLWTRIVNLIDPSNPMYSQIAVQTLSQIILVFIPIGCANKLVYWTAERLLMADIKAQPHAIPALCSTLISSNPPPLLRAHVLGNLSACLRNDIAPIVLEQISAMKLEDIMILQEPTIESLQLIVKNGEFSSKTVRVASLLSLEHKKAEKLLLDILQHSHIEMDLHSLSLLINALSILILERGDVELADAIYPALFKNTHSVELTYLLTRNLSELKRLGHGTYLRKCLEQTILSMRNEPALRNELLWTLICNISDSKQYPLNAKKQKCFQKEIAFLHQDQSKFLEAFLLTNTIQYPLPGFSLSQWNSKESDATTKTLSNLPDKQFDNQVFLKKTDILMNIDKNRPNELVVRSVLGRHLWSLHTEDDTSLHFHPHIKNWLKGGGGKNSTRRGTSLPNEASTTTQTGEGDVFEKFPLFPHTYKSPIDSKPMLDFIKKSTRIPVERPSTADIYRTTPCDDCALVGENVEELGTWRRLAADLHLIDRVCEVKSNFGRDLRHLDGTLSREVHKMAVIYVCKGQEDKNSILNNCSGSEEFNEFVNSLGRIVTIGDHHQGYKGGLAAGQRAPYFADAITETIFHVSTFLTGDLTQKTKHLGNDEVHIIWTEHYRPYRRDTIATKFCDVLIVLQPISSAMIRVNIETAKPFIFGPLFDGAYVHISEIAQMVRETAINASRAYRISQVNCDRPNIHRQKIFDETIKAISFMKPAAAITQLYVPSLKS
uniref:Rap-GAP domain-containing protein n=1 Tax=Rhabditophanes sp. KR3021 TaxID=114890 RepID=A0AC35TQP1_9BILA